MTSAGTALRDAIARRRAASSTCHRPEAQGGCALSRPPPKATGRTSDNRQDGRPATAALKANKFSTATDDKTAARDTLDRVRAFIKARPTVYLTSHCPEGYESLALKRVMKLA